MTSRLSICPLKPHFPVRFSFGGFSLSSVGEEVHQKNILGAAAEDVLSIPRTKSEHEEHPGKHDHKGRRKAHRGSGYFWLTAGLGCDGDTVATTAAAQPSIEDLLSGALPWVPKVNFRNPFLAYENGDEFVRVFREVAEGKSTKPFILVVEGSIPDEGNKDEGYWASFGTDPVLKAHRGPATFR